MFKQNINIKSRDFNEHIEWLSIFAVSALIIFIFPLFSHIAQIKIISSQLISSI
jgi:hypothetical protein